MRRWSITWPRDEFVVSSSGVVAVTSTVSVTVPTSRRMGRLTVSPTRTSILSRTKRLKPVSSAETRYMPGGKNGSW